MSASEAFARVAEQAVDRMLALDPVSATWLGDHRFDGSLPDLSSAGVKAALGVIDDAVTEVDAVDDLELDVDDLVDLETCRSGLQRARFELADLRRHEWDPLTWNPGTALYLLVAREIGPAADRAEALVSRLRLVPDHLATGRAQLSHMSAIHVETAIAQLAGTRALIDGPVRRAVAGSADPVDAAGAVDAAVRAVDEFVGWLTGRLATADRDPRLGSRLYAGALWHGLDEQTSATDLLAAAYARLDELTGEMADLAAQYLGRDAAGGAGGAGGAGVAAALAQIAADAPVDDRTVLGEMELALAATTAFVAEQGLVRVPQLDVRVIEMPQLHRGVAVAYCDAPGPLEAARVPTFVAVSPAPADWSPERVASFYREYNAVALHVLTVHEAMPGHVLQLARAAQCLRPTRVRAVGRSGTFVEGWAVHCEQVVADAGYRPGGTARSGLAFALQQRKMAVRAALNAILDIGVHAQGLTESEAMALMRERGFQEDGEAAGKWRRALLTAGQLPTYFAGGRAVTSIVEDLRVLHPDWGLAQVHDLVLSHGSPAPRHLRTLLGL